MQIRKNERNIECNLKIALLQMLPSLRLPIMPNLWRNKFCSMTYNTKPAMRIGVAGSTGAYPKGSIYLCIYGYQYEYRYLRVSLAHLPREYHWDPPGKREGKEERKRCVLTCVCCFTGGLANLPAGTRTRLADQFVTASV